MILLCFAILAFADYVRYELLFIFHSWNIISKLTISQNTNLAMKTHHTVRHGDVWNGRWNNETSFNGSNRFSYARDSAHAYLWFHSIAHWCEVPIAGELTLNDVGSMKSQCSFRCFGEEDASWITAAARSISLWSPSETAESTICIKNRQHIQFCTHIYYDTHYTA